MKCECGLFWFSVRGVDDPVDIVGGWVAALNARFGAEGLPAPDRFQAAIELVEQAQEILRPVVRLRLVASDE